MKHLPNALTLLRLVLAPVVAWLFWEGIASMGGAYLAVTANTLTASAALFALAAFTDLFDGMAARAFNAHSKFGRIIDPIADKLLVGLPLIAIAITIWQSKHATWPIVAIATAVIVGRDILMTVIRLTSPDGEGARVSSLAKVKTALELLTVGSLLIIVAIFAQMQARSPGADAVPPVMEAFVWLWPGLLAVTAALSAWTGLQYLRPAKREP